MLQSLAFLALGAHAAPQWGQNGGGRLRAGVSPASRLSGNVGEKGAVALSANPRVAGAAANSFSAATRLGAPYPVIEPTTVLQYEATLTSEPIFSKTPCPAVDSTGRVLAALPTAILVSLPNPDSLPATGWAAGSPSIITAGDAANATADALATDLVLDASDNPFMLVDDRNSLAGVGFGWDSGLEPLPWASNGQLALQGNLRLTALYHMSALVGATPSGGGGAPGIFMGTAALISQRGLAVLNTDTGCSMSPSCLGGGGAVPPGTLPPTPDATCCLQSPGLEPNQGQTYGTVVGCAYLDGSGAACLLDHSLSAQGNALALFDEQGVPKWTSSVQSKPSGNAPPPTIDPYTGNIYWLGSSAASANAFSPNRVFCAQGTSGGAPCPGYSNDGNFFDLTSVFSSLSPGVSLEWAYALALVPDTDNGSVLRLLATISTHWGGASNGVVANPTGCVLALDPASAAVVDYYCIPRDMASYFAADNYLATAPLVALDARGPGLHTALVAQFDVIVFGLDPMNLAGGLLFAVDPFPGDENNPGKETTSYSTDYLALTDGGTLVGQGWDDTQNMYTVFAVPGILTYTPPPPSPGPTPPTSPSPSPKVLASFTASPSHVPWVPASQAQADATAAKAAAARSNAGAGLGGFFGGIVAGALGLLLAQKVLAGTLVSSVNKAVYGERTPLVVSPRSGAPYSSA